MHSCSTGRVRHQPQPLSSIQRGLSPTRPGPGPAAPDGVLAADGQEQSWSVSPVAAGGGVGPCPLGTGSQGGCEELRAPARRRRWPRGHMSPPPRAALQPPGPRHGAAGQSWLCPHVPAARISLQTPRSCHDVALGPWPVQGDGSPGLGQGGGRKCRCTPMQTAPARNRGSVLL